eukprot:scaffold2991_cov403-Prasinococcus_capsulatus_cf.AAC.8
MNRRGPFLPQALPTMNPPRLERRSLCTAEGGRYRTACTAVASCKKADDARRGARPTTRRALAGRAGATASAVAMRPPACAAARSRRPPLRCVPRTPTSPPAATAAAAAPHAAQL